MTIFDSISNYSELTDMAPMYYLMKIKDKNITRVRRYKKNRKALNIYRKKIDILNLESN